MTTRREFLKRCVTSSAAVASGALLWPRGLAADEQPKPSERPSGEKRRWKTAFGLNGFMSSESVFGGKYPIREVLAFAEKEGFDGIELVQGWPKELAPYPAPDDDRRIGEIRKFVEDFGVKIFSIQTGSAGAFRKDPAARKKWIKQFAGWARFARKAGCECIGTWPGGGLDGRTVDQGIDALVGSLKEAAKIVTDENLLLSVEIEPPFVFNRIDHLIRIIDGVGHPRVRGMYDPSHYDLMTGGRGKPEEALQKVGVQRLGYIHLTDTDGTIFRGTSRHLPCGDGHVDIPRSLEILWNGGFTGWIMVDPWMTKDPYDACRKGRRAVEKAQRELSRRG